LNDGFENEEFVEHDPPGTRKRMRHFGTVFDYGPPKFGLTGVCGTPLLNQNAIQEWGNPGERRVERRNADPSLWMTRGSFIGARGIPLLNQNAILGGSS
jgi:hypothetical protein